MNIVLDISNFQLGYLYFLQSKPNMIMDGTFSKIIYSNDAFSLNSVYLYLPLEISSIDRFCNKTIVKFANDNPFNVSLIQELSKIEHRIIEYYKQTHPNKSSRGSLLSIYKQLVSGSLKLFRDYNGANIDELKNGLKFMLKISGVWESPNDIGLTFKIIEYGL
jgi:hypothetical protein